MENQDRQRDVVSRVIEILRKVTRIVQIAPFVYLAFYAAYLFVGCFVSDEVISLIDGFMNTSPVVTTGMLVLSKLLKLCKWHKTACLIPSVSQIEGFIDGYVFTFTQMEIMLINLLLGIASLSYIIYAHRHFFNGR